MPKITLPKAYMLEEVLDDNARIVRDEVVGKRRWSIEHELVFKHDGKLYRTQYSVGATEQQDETPWEYVDEVECTEVEAYERTVIDYRVVP